MNVNPGAVTHSAAAHAPLNASLAGTARAAARGGESDKQAAEASRQQQSAEKPAGQSPETQVDAGDETGDRGGDGRQVLDRFEQRASDGEPEDDAEDQAGDPRPAPPRVDPAPSGPGQQLDLEA